MATVTNWIDHLNKPAEEVAGAIYPGAGSSEGLLVILAIIINSAQILFFNYHSVILLL